MSQYSLIGTVSPLVANIRTMWFTVDTIRGGTTSMRLAGRTYLPQEKKEKDDNYANRLARSVFDNFYNEAIDRSVDKVFAKDIVLKDQPEDIVLWSNDVDQQGRDITQFNTDVFWNMVHHGVTYVLTDYPRLPSEGYANRAAEMAAGRRPYLVNITAPQVLACDSQTIAGKERLASFRYQEDVYELGDDGLSIEKFQQVRHFEQREAVNAEGVKTGRVGPVTVKVYRNRDGTGWVQEGDAIVLPVDAIPVVANYGNRVGYYLGTPVMQSLAELNLQHWRKRSDLDNILHIANVPFLFGKGFGAETSTATGRKAGPIEVDIQQAVMASNKDADLKWVEHTGSNIKSAMEDLKNLEDRMRDLGSTLFSSGGSYNTSATEKSINAAEANARLKALALALQDSIEYSLYFVKSYLGSPQVGTVEVNTSFSVDFVANETFAAVLTLYKMGIVTWAVVVSEAKRRNILSLDTDIQPPVAPALGKSGDNEVIPPVVDATGNVSIVANT